MSTLVLEHLKHTNASSNNITLAADGSITVDTTTLKVDATNNRVGVGTTSPGYPLQVNGSVDILNVKGSTGNAFVRFTDSDATADFSIGSDDGSFAGSGSFILYDRTNGAYRLAVNSNGHVLTPSQPRFYSKNMNFPYQSGGYGTGGTVDVNNGSVYNSSNGRFTAPVAGTYMFHMMTQYYDGATGSYITAKFYKNDVFQALEAYHGFGNANHAQACLTQMMTLASGDYINAYTDFGARDIQNFFSGYLIG